MDYFSLLLKRTNRVLSISRYLFNLWSTLKNEREKSKKYDYSIISDSSKEGIQPQTFEYSTDRLAFISILPPDESGIATYSLKTFSEKNIDLPVDLYCPFKSENHKLNNKKEIKNKFVKLHSLQNFFDNNEVYKYSVIFIAVGGSCHHAYIINLLKEIREHNLLNKVYLYLHDLHFRDFFMFYSGMNIWKFAITNMQLYGDPRYRDCSIGSLINILRALNQLQLNYNLGLRFFQKLGITHFLVNSEAAKELLSNDLDKNSPFIIEKVFLPVLPISSDIDSSIILKESGYVHIGSFGIPSAGKCTPQLIRAIEELNNNGYKIKLIIAGWNAFNYMKSNKINKDWLLVFDSLKENELITLMSQMDLAIQLRSMNGGESSGCVPMLISCTVPTIVSNVGSFAEYGAEVIKFKGNVECDLANFIGKVLDGGIHNAVDIKAMHKYVIKHQPKEFVKKLFSLAH